MQHKKLSLIGYASAIAGANPGSADGPLVLRKSSYLAALASQGLDLHWDAMIHTGQGTPPSKLVVVADLCQNLADKVAQQVKDKNLFTVFGGDHSCAIGTWSGAASSIDGPMGLLWIDAHMDSHTLATSETGNIHGMPVACLLGQGDSSLTQILSKNPKIKPENICLIGIRSYEAGEANLLNKLNVKIFFMDEIKQRGLQAVMADALEIVTRNTIAYGVSIDIDSMDPEDAPGTGVAEPDGIRAKELCECLTVVANDPRLIGFEIAEFDPHRDKNEMTEQLIPKLMSAIMVGKS